MSVSGGGSGAIQQPPSTVKQYEATNIDRKADKEIKKNELAHAGVNKITPQSINQKERKAP